MASPSIRQGIEETLRHEKHFATFPRNNEYRFTNREFQVLALLIAGYSTKQVASQLVITLSTVAAHRQHIMEKMGVHEWASVVWKALFARLDR